MAGDGVRGQALAAQVDDPVARRLGGHRAGLKRVALLLQKREEL